MAKRKERAMTCQLSRLRRVQNFQAIYACPICKKLTNWSYVAEDEEGKKKGQAGHNMDGGRLGSSLHWGHAGHGA